MKKFICMLAVAILMIGATASCTSCNKDVNWGIEYSLQSDGMANGNVVLTFDGGSFTLDGQANYIFEWHNTVFLNATRASLPLDEGLEAEDADTVAAAQKVESWLNDFITVTSAGGTYDIYVKGYVKETATGITFAIDRHFTNMSADETIDYE